MKKRIRRIAFFLVITMLLELVNIPVCVRADYFDEDSNFYLIELDDGTILVTGYKKIQSSLAIPSTLLGRKVTGVALNNQHAYAYDDSDVVAGSLTIPDSVTFLGNNQGLPFNGDLIIGSGVKEGGSFSGSDFTGKLILRDGMTSLGDFAHCQFTGNLVIPDTVSSIGCFQDCKGFTGDLIIPDAVTYLDDLTFLGCSGFNGRLKLSNSLQYLGDNAFRDCVNFTGKLELPESLTFIEHRAFENCGFTGELYIPQNVGYIDYNAFRDCEKLTSAIISGKETGLSSHTFYSCDNLKKIENHSKYACQLYLISENHTWKNVKTGEIITEIAEGTAIRDDYDGSVEEEEEEEETKTITVSFNSMGGSSVSSQKIEEGKTAKIPKNPQRDGYKFKGWFTDKDCTYSVNFNAPLHKNTIFYAKWEKNNVYILEQDVEINGKGEAHAVLPLYEYYYEYINGAKIKCKLNEGEEFELEPDKNTYVDVVWKTDTDTEVLNPLGKSKNKIIKGELFLEKGAKRQKIYTVSMNVKIKPLSYSQSWEAGTSADIEAMIGAEQGEDAGAAKAKFVLAEFKATGKEGSWINIENQYEDGTRNLILKKKILNGAGLGIEIGPKGKLGYFGEGVDFSPLDGEAGISYGNTSEFGTKIIDYDPNNEKDLLDVGKFIVGAIAINNDNVFLVDAVKDLGSDIYNYYGKTDAVELKAGANLGHLEFENVAEYSLASVDYSQAYELSNEADEVDKTHSSGCKKESELNGSILNVEEKGMFRPGVVFSDFSKNLSKKEYFINHIHVDDTIADSTLIVNRLLGYDDVGIFGIKASSKENCEFSYSSMALGKAARETDILRYMSDPLGFLFNTDIDEVFEKLDTLQAWVDYNKTHSEEFLVNIPFHFSFSYGAGGEGEISFTGVDSMNYSFETGECYEGEMFVKSRSDIKDLVNSKRQNIAEITGEPLKAVANKMGNTLKDTKNKANELIKNGAIKTKALWDDFVGEVSERTVTLIGFAENKIRDSYVISTFTSTEKENPNNDIPLLKAKDDDTANNTVSEGKAITIGTPYIVNVSNDEEGEDIVYDFSDYPLILTFTYSDDEISAAGISEKQMDFIGIYKYSEDLLGYVPVGGTIDKANKEVSAIITKSGQYLLAADLSANTISDNNSSNNDKGDNNNNENAENQETTSENNTPSSNGLSGNNASVLPQTLARTSSASFTAGSDTYTVNWNSFVQFDGRKHNGEGTKESGSKVSDLKLTVMKNGELVDPSQYTVKAKNNKNATVSIDGTTAIPGAKTPSYKLKFKGKEFKEANKAVKSQTFEFGIVPAELKQDAVTFDKVKTGKDGSVQIKKMTFKPESASSVALKPLKLKFKKKEDKTDYVTETGSDGSVKVIGKNNYYGSVVYTK